MNIFRVLRSGRYPISEDHVSAFVAALFSPQIDHALGAVPLANLLLQVSQHIRRADLTEIAHKLRATPPEDLASHLRVEVEFFYLTDTPNGHGYIDIVIHYDQWVIAIENKIKAESRTHGQVQEQYAGLRQRLRRDNQEEYTVLMLYLVPAIKNGDTWTVSQLLLDEVSFPMQGNDCAAIVPWQPTHEYPYSYVQLIQDLLDEEEQGQIAIRDDLRHILRACIDFALHEFQGYDVLRPTPPPAQWRPVAELLQSDEPLFVGINNGMDGTIRKAWHNPDFLKESVKVLEEHQDNHCVSLHDFKILVRWAQDPDQHSLKGIEWKQRPFFTSTLYLVAKTAGDELFIAFQGGLDALKQAPPDTIRNRRSWQISTRRETTQWVSGTEFCAVLESKGVTFTQPQN